MTEISSGLEIELTHKGRYDLKEWKGEGGQKEKGEMERKQEQWLKQKEFLRASSRGNNQAA